MIRKRENPLAIKAGILALLVHGVFFLLLIMSFNWRSAQPYKMTEVELWDSLPTPVVVQPPPPEPKPAPVPKPVVAPTPEPTKPEPKAEIVVKPKKPEPKPKPVPEKKKEETPKPDPALKAKEEEKKREEALKKLQQDLLNDDLAQDAQQAEAQRLKNERAAAESRKLVASKGAIDDAMSKIMQKIYSRMNRQACGSAVPVYKIFLLPTGELSDKPKLLNSSGIQACDDAASRAILQAQPLPMPDNMELFQTIRDITITFKPE